MAVSDSWLQRVQEKPFTVPEYMAMCGIRGQVNHNFRSHLGTWTVFCGAISSDTSPELIKNLKLDLQQIVHNFYDLDGNISVSGLTIYDANSDISISHLTLIRVLLNDAQKLTLDAHALRYMDGIKRKRRLMRLVTRFPETVADIVAKLVD